MAKPIRNASKHPKGRGPQRAPETVEAKQPRPSGPYFQIGPAWKADIKSRLEIRGMSQAELARRIGASPGSVVLIFKPKTVQSRLGPAIHKALDLEPPASMVGAAA